METAGSEGESDRNINCQFDGSKKRKRQMKTPFQLKMLEKTYALEINPSKDTIEKLSETLGLTDRQLQMWFCSRRLKDKKDHMTAKRAARDCGVREPTESLNQSKQDLTVAEGGGGGGSHHDSLSLKMEKSGVLKFEVGQLAETKTFERGFRSAWFRCKIRDISLKNNKILPEYYDFPGEDITWGKIYEKPPYGRKKNFRKQLMVRPHYPPIYHKSQMPPVNSISEVCVIIDGAWKVGDMVDWYEDDCYWSASIIKILSDDKVQIELPELPVGQGEIYEARCKDLRPSLDWFPRKGWKLATMKGQASCSAQLIYPSPQGMNFERDEVASPLINASSTSPILVISLAAPMEESPQSQEEKMSGDDVEKESSSDSISNMGVEESKADDAIWEDVNYNNIDLNIMHEETLEASIIDLEELANKIKWLSSILDNNQPRSGTWKLV